MATLQFFLKLDYFSEKILKKVNTELLPKGGMVLFEVQNFVAAARLKSSR